jgi:hypothetical protein
MLEIRRAYAGVSFNQKNLSKSGINRNPRTQQNEEGQLSESLHKIPYSYCKNNFSCGMSVLNVSSGSC